MTYTTASGEVIPQGTDAFNPPAQFKTWADHGALWHNRIVVALDANRTALAAPELRDGIECYVTGTDITWLYEGSTWKRWNSGWITYTPTLTGFAVGTIGTPAPVSETKYRYVNGRVRVYFKFVFGSNGTPPTSARITTPVAAATLGVLSIVGGTGNILRIATGTQYPLAPALYNSVNTIALFYTNGALADFTPTVPWTWANGDYIVGELEYDPA